MEQKADFGIVGLAVMGENLALNIEGRGFTVAVYNRTASRVAAFLDGRGRGHRFLGAATPAAFCAALARPRRIMLMVKAGDAVDATATALLPYLEPGDVVIDGGNSNYNDTERRVREYGAKGILFVGCGVSGGELGALHGPSLMPGGNAAAWPLVRPVFEAATARAGDNEPCCAWMGTGGAGHFVKMVHNGIEYGDMQGICEGYDLLRRVLGFDDAAAAAAFDRWNKGHLASYLVEITAAILRYQDVDGTPLVEHILDAAGQKGTGKWTGMTALDEGVALDFITEAVYARVISARKELRMKLATMYAPGSTRPAPRPALNETDIEGAVYAAKLISYAQGFELITKKSAEMGWGVRPDIVAKIWRGGCIIRSTFLDDIADAYANGPVESLLLSDFYRTSLPQATESLRKVVAAAALAGVPIPAMGAALAYYDAVRSARLPANLLQAQRDYFGAHTYERTDAPRGQFFHTNWTGEGGTTASTQYTR